MEPVKAKIRKVPEDRIKVLSGGCKLFEGDNIEQAKQSIADQMARELVEKLFEFKKVEKIAEFEGVYWYRTSIEIIVPPTPENHI